jgi:hypothetical protein
MAQIAGDTRLPQRDPEQVLPKQRGMCVFPAPEPHDLLPEILREPVEQGGEKLRRQLRRIFGGVETKAHCGCCKT